MAFLGFDHVDLRVPSLAAVEAFYDALLPRLGLAKKRYMYVDPHGEWHLPEGDRPNTAEWYEDPPPAAGPPRFFGVIEDDDMTIPRTRIAFAAASRAEVERWTGELPGLGARNVDPIDEGRYVAVFFEDPLGTRLEIVARAPRL